MKTSKENRVVLNKDFTESQNHVFAFFPSFRETGCKVLRNVV